MSDRQTGSTLFHGAAAAFHSHLDECRQCADHPFDLCPSGTVLMNLARVILDTEASRTPAENRPERR
jgi:hypothetical protein